MRLLATSLNIDLLGPEGFSIGMNAVVPFRPHDDQGAGYSNRHARLARQGAGVVNKLHVYVGLPSRTSGVLPR